jgi:hypothetical protein
MVKIQKKITPEKMFSSGKKKRPDWPIRRTHQYSSNQNPNSAAYILNEDNNYRRRMQTNDSCVVID